MLPKKSSCHLRFQKYFLIVFSVGYSCECLFQKSMVYLPLQIIYFSELCFSLFLNQVHACVDMIYAVQCSRTIADRKMLCRTLGSCSLVSPFLFIHLPHLCFDHYITHVLTRTRMDIMLHGRLSRCVSRLQLSLSEHVLLYPNKRNRKKCFKFTLTYTCPLSP